ncbi:hypothetical protein [Bradyrhizobium sp. WSM4349]|uniref:hypothetical protein n=1 Tax=Bradyrhizobium sp. WSM4349 TaxID=1040988 RepID=UPI0012F7E87A|nr:hypothetical protein [Bradyrhizobium sp. WSM4349]
MLANTVTISKRDATRFRSAGASAMDSDNGSDTAAPFVKDCADEDRKGGCPKANCKKRPILPHRKAVAQRRELRQSQSSRRQNCASEDPFHSIIYRIRRAQL